MMRPEPGHPETVAPANPHMQLTGPQTTRTWLELRARYGIYVRLLEGLPSDSFHRVVIRDMRTPAELVVHVSGTVVHDIVRGIAAGRIESGEPSESEFVDALSSKKHVISFARESWSDADAAAQEIDDASLMRLVGSSWGIELSGAEWLTVVFDEFMHHRGQLFAYSRALSVPPPSMWQFAENEAPFRDH